MSRKTPCDLLIHNAGWIATMSGGEPGAHPGPRWNDVGISKDAALASANGKIIAAGPEQQVVGAVDSSGAEVIDADRMGLMPGFIDPHTHFLFAGCRAEEYAMRVEGVDYVEIRRRGGGIRSSVRAFREAGDDALRDDGRKRLDLFLANGVTTVEGKSGYGLTTHDEIRALRIMKELNDDHPIDVVSTFLGAHDFPPEYDDRKDDYVSLIVNEMIPAAAPLAEFCDVFCEEGYFTVEQSRSILEAAKSHGMKPRLHAEEFEAIGGGRLAAELKAVSADHLMAVPPEEVKLMAESGVVAVLLPGTAIGLARARWADPAKFRKHGQPMAIATDCNPGSSYSTSLPLIMSLACSLLRMTVPEVLFAATRNAAAALDLEGSVGSLERGKRADVLLVNAGHPSALPYRFGENLVAGVIKSGKRVI